MKPLGAAYCCARAFVLAEFAASLQWQMVSIVQAWGNQSLGVEILITMVVFGGCYIGGSFSLLLKVHVRYGFLC